MILASLDPGSSHCGLVIGEKIETPEGPRLHLIENGAHSIEVGRLIDRKGGPQTITKHYTDRRTGEAKSYSYVLDKQREIRAGDEEAAGDAIVALLIQHRVAELVIERVEAMYTSEGKTARETARRASGQGTNLLHAERVATWVRARCKALGITVTDVPRATWVTRVAGKARANDADVYTALRSLLAPEDLEQLCYRDRKDTVRIKPDRRDACGALLWRVLPPLPKRKPTKPRRPFYACSVADCGWSGANAVEAPRAPTCPTCGAMALETERPKIPYDPVRAAERRRLLEIFEKEGRPTKRISTLSPAERKRLLRRYDLGALGRTPLCEHLGCWKPVGHQTRSCPTRLAAEAIRIKPLAEREPPRVRADRGAYVVLPPPPLPPLPGAPEKATEEEPVPPTPRQDQLPREPPKRRRHDRFRPKGWLGS